MKALVTGAGGFVGPRLVRALRKEGWSVRPHARRGGFPKSRFDVVFHLAAASHPASTVGSAERTYRDNVETTSRLVDDVRARRIVLASTGQLQDLRPTTPYAASKLCAEAVVLAARPESVVLRALNHTGPGQSDLFVVPYITREIVRAERGGPRTIRLRDLAPKIDLFDVEDMVRAYVLAARKGRPGAIYTVGTGHPISVERIAKTLAGMARVPIRITGPRRDRSVLSSDSTLFGRATGWRPLIPLRDTLARVLDHARHA